MNRKVLVSLAIVFIATAAVSQVGEKITVNVIEVPVTVVDRDGNPVRGLTRANFELYDDGKLQTITGFDKVDFATDEASSAISPQNPVARRSFMLLFDLGFSSPTSLARAQDAARRFVKESVKPRDLVAVGTIEPEHGFRLMTAFTTDRELVESAIAQPESFRGTDPLQLANVTRTFEATHGENTADANQPTRPLLDGKDQADNYQLDLVRQISRANEPFVRGRIEKEIGGLGLLASTLRAVPGRKQVVLLSEGFDPKYVRGRDVREKHAEDIDMRNITTGQIWNIDSDARYGNTNSMKVLEEMAKLFRGSDVVLNAIDIQGVRLQNDLSGERINSNEGLFLLARPTGGEVFQNNNNLNVDFSKMLRQQEVVYVLSFSAQTSRPGKFHNLTVKLIDVPGGARPAYRAGYYESGAETPQQRTLTTAEIVMNDIPQSDIHIAAMSGAFPASGGEAQVPVIIEMNGADLLKNEHGDRAVTEIYIYAFDDEGLVRDRLYQRITLDLAKVGSRLRAGGLKYYGTLSLPPGRYAIKSLVKIADTDRRGFARTDLVVPRGGDVAMMPFFIDEKPGEWVMVKGTVHGGGGYPFSIKGEALIPAAGARDRAGQVRKLAVVVLNAKPEEIDTNAKVLDRITAGNATQLILQPGAAARAVSVDVKKGGVSAETRVALQ